MSVLTASAAKAGGASAISKPATTRKRMRMGRNLRAGGKFPRQKAAPNNDANAGKAREMPRRLSARNLDKIWDAGRRSALHFGKLGSVHRRPVDFVLGQNPGLLQRGGVPLAPGRQRH